MDRDEQKRLVLFCLLQEKNWEIRNGGKWNDKAKQGKESYKLRIPGRISLQSERQKED